MKILFLSWNFAPVIGGIEYLVTHLYRGFCRAGHDVRVLTAYAEGVSGEDGIVRAPKRGVRGFLSHALWQGMAQCRSFRPDVIFCGSVVAASVAWILGKAFRLRYVVMIYGSDLVFCPWWYQLGMRFVLRRADRLVSISRYTTQLAEAAGLDMGKVNLIHPGVDVARFSGTRAGAAETILGLSEGRRVLLSVGRLIHRKGIADFVEHVLPRVVERCPDALLLVVGDDPGASLAHRGGERAKIEAKIAACHLEEHVNLLGEIPDDELRALYFRADLFVLPVLDVPGDVEGFGIVFLEAGLAKTACVATCVGGIPDAVADGETGLLAEPGDHDDLARKIILLLDDEELRTRLAERGAARARTEFGWDTITAKHVAVLREVIGGRA